MILFHKLFGFCLLLIPAESAAGFITFLNLNGIIFWKSEMTPDGCLIRTSLFSTDKALRAAEQNNITVAVLKTVGLPFVIYKYRLRKGLIVGTALGFALMFVSTLFVWEVKVSGNVKLTSAEIEAMLYSSGCRAGVYIPRFDVRKSEIEFLLAHREVSSLSINIIGTTASVELIERVFPPDIIDDEGYYDLVASRDGIIVKIQAAEGVPVVAVGDVVSEGQMLVSGELNGRFGSVYHRHSRGNVYAEYIEVFSLSVPLKQSVKDYTGRESVKTAYTVLGKELRLFSNLTSPFDYSDAEIINTPVSVFGLKTPVVKTTVTYREYQPAVVTLSEYEAHRMALNDFGSWQDLLEGEIISVLSQNGSIENGKYVFKAEVKAVADIAVEKERDIINELTESG